MSRTSLSIRQKGDKAEDELKCLMLLAYIRMRNSCEKLSNPTRKVERRKLEGWENTSIKVWNKVNKVPVSWLVYERLS